MLDLKSSSYSTEEIKNWSTKELCSNFSTTKWKDKKYTEYLCSNEVYYCDAHNTLREIDKVEEQNRVNSFNLEKIKEEIIFRVNNHSKEVAFYDKDNSMKKGYVIPKKDENDELGFIICDTNEPDSLHGLMFKMYTKNSVGISKYRIDRNEDGSIKWVESSKVYDDIYDYRSDYSRVVEYNGKYGIIDKNGRELIPPKYDDISFEVSGFEKVKLGDKWAVMSKDGKLLSDFKYDKIELIEGFWRTDNDPIIVNVEKKYGVVNKEGKTILPIKYNRVRRLENYDLLMIREGSNYSLSDFSGKSILPLEKYDEIKTLAKDLIQARVNSKSGLYTIKGEEIAPPIYDWIVEDRFNKNNKDLFEFCRDKFPSEMDESESIKKRGYIDKSGNEIDR